MIGPRAPNPRPNSSWNSVASGTRKTEKEKKRP